MEPIALAIGILSFVCSGLVWTTGGYFANWRKNHQNTDWAGFDKKKLKNDILLGLVLGGGSVVYAVYTGDAESWVIPTAQQFLQSVGANFVVVALVDKYIVGGLFNK